MTKDLSALKIALLVADGFEQVEMTEPRKALEQAGAQVDLVSPAHNNVKSWDMHNWSKSFSVDVLYHPAKTRCLAELF